MDLFLYHVRRSAYNEFVLYRVDLLFVDFDAIYALVGHTLTVGQRVLEYVVVVVLDHDSLVHHLLHVCEAFLFVDASGVLALIHVLAVAELGLRLLVLRVKRNCLVHLRVRLLFGYRHFHDVVDEVALLERAVEVALFRLFTLILRRRLELDFICSCLSTTCF